MAELMEQRMREIAMRIHAVREDVGISTEEMAKKTGVSVEEYVKIESGECDFNFTFIYKFAQACNIAITDVMEGNSPILTKYTVTRKGNGMVIKQRGGYSYDHHHLAPLFKNKLAEPFFVEVPYDENELYRPTHFSSHEGQELDIILKGCAKIQFEDTYEILYEGDTIYYDSSIPHDILAMGGEKCELYAIVMNPDAKGAAECKVHHSKNVITNVDKAELANPIYEKFVETQCNERGRLKGISFKNEDKFNFAFDIVDGLASKCPNKTAVIHLDPDKKERRFTFKDISRLSSKAANYFESLGIKKGDKIMLVLRRNYQFWIAINALHKIGAIVVPATDLLTQHDFEYRFNAASIDGIVCTSHGEVSTYAQNASKNSKSLKHLIIANGSKEGWHNFDEEYKEFSDVYERKADSACGDDPMLMFFTSGTTGHPKIALHNFRYPLGHFITAKYWHNVDPNGIHFTIADTGWGKALWGKLYGQWLCETPVFVYDFERFNADDILPLFAKYHITTFCAPPTMYRFFIKEDLSKYDLSSIKYATVAGEALNPEVFNQFLKVTGIGIIEGFGQTETTLSIANLIGADIKPGSMGKPTPLYDIRILLPDGTEAKAGEVGEIAIKIDEKTPCGLFAGYYNDEEKTKEVWHDGYYFTGDTAWKDQDGFFWFVGRVDDVIKSSGYRIGPFEIESVIMELPYVLECAVTAAPDEVRGQVVKATIVLTKGTVASDELKKEIQNYVKKQTAPYKYPRIVEFRDELPKTISGKIRRVELK